MNSLSGPAYKEHIVPLSDDQWLSVERSDTALVLTLFSECRWNVDEIGERALARANVRRRSGPAFSVGVTRNLLVISHRMLRETSDEAVNHVVVLLMQFSAECRKD